MHFSRLSHFLCPLLIVGLCLFPQLAIGKVLKVGPGKKFDRIERAVAKAKPGDIVEVYPLENDQAYEATAVAVRKPRITIRAAGIEQGRRVKVSGAGYLFSGRGSKPRAIFQFNPKSHGSTLEGFEITGASNNGKNGAGVRINQANDITIRNCDIHHNQMGIMSNGKVELRNAINQRIEHTTIHHNLRHNLYLGGTSVTLRFCEVHTPIELHNVKSRAHFTRVEYSYVHHSANREFDLVDSGQTALPGSHAVLLGNIIAKDPHTLGNHSVIHFGQDNDLEHDGTLYMVHNTVITPFSAPVIDLSSKRAGALLIGNIFDSGNSTRNNQVIGSALRGGASTNNINGWGNWFSSGFIASIAGTRINKSLNTLVTKTPELFINPQQHDYRLLPSVSDISKPVKPLDRLLLPMTPGTFETEEPLAWQYEHPVKKSVRVWTDHPAPGAMEADSHRDLR